MPTATLASHTVDVCTTGDGMLVRLGGALGADATAQLRGALLGLRPFGCDDVIVDAGDVTDVDDDALAVLLAASAWVVDTGGRLSFSQMSQPLRREVALVGLCDELRMLEPVGGRDETIPVPPRSASGS